MIVPSGFDPSASNRMDKAVDVKGCE